MTVEYDCPYGSHVPKDMMDRWIAAATAREFVEGRGTEVGGGDGLETIILPLPLPKPVIAEVLKWPSLEKPRHFNTPHYGERSVEEAFRQNGCGLSFIIEKGEIRRK
jgi:hypothetical protein